MNVCGYVRVSSDGQTENYSIPQQQKAIPHSLIKKIVLQGDEIQIFWRFE